MRYLQPDEYFEKRIMEDRQSFEESYWLQVSDPDGQVFDKEDRKGDYMNNISTELNYINSHAPGKILDIGCGMGFLLSGVNTAWEKYGLEISRYAGEIAKKWATIHIGTLEEAGYQQDYFDIIVTYHVIEHIQDPISFIKKIYEILKQGGKLIVGTPDFDSGCARLFGDNYRLLQDKTHISLFSSDSMHRFLRDHGFVIEYVDYPFFKTSYFTIENLMRLFDTSKISPPFYGNFMTFYCIKK